MSCKLDNMREDQIYEKCSEAKNLKMILGRNSVGLEWCEYDFRVR